MVLAIQDIEQYERSRYSGKRPQPQELSPETLPQERCGEQNQPEKPESHIHEMHYELNERKLAACHLFKIEHFIRIPQQEIDDKHHKHHGIMPQGIVGYNFYECLHFRCHFLAPVLIEHRFALYCLVQSQP